MLMKLNPGVSHKGSTYRAFHRYGQARFVDGGLILANLQLPLKIMINFKKMSKLTQKLIIFLC